MGEDSISKDPTSAINRYAQNGMDDISDEDALYIINKMKQKRAEQAKSQSKYSQIDSNKSEKDIYFENKVLEKINRLSSGEKQTIKNRSMSDWFNPSGEAQAYGDVDPLSSALTALHRKDFGSDDDSKQYYTRDQYANSNRVSGLLEGDIMKLSEMMQKDVLSDAVALTNARDNGRMTPGEERNIRTSNYQNEMAAAFAKVNSTSDNFVKNSINRMDGEPEEVIDSSFGLVDEDRINKVIEARKRMSSANVDRSKAIKRSYATDDERREHWDNREHLKSQSLQDVYSNSFLITDDE